MKVVMKVGLARQPFIPTGVEMVGPWNCPHGPVRQKRKPGHLRVQTHKSTGVGDRRGPLSPCSLPLEALATKENLLGAPLEEFSRALRADLEAVDSDLTLTPS